MNLKNCLLILLLLPGLTAFGQSRDTATVNKLVSESKKLVGSDSAKAVNLGLQAREMAHELKYSKGEANALKYIGMVYYLRGLYVQSVTGQSLEVFKK
jgi:hypothetical protein